LGRVHPGSRHKRGPAGNVFEVLLAQIDELNGDLASDMVVGRRRDMNAAGLSDAFKSRRNIYVVAKNIMWLDNHVADIDTDTESNAPVFRVTNCKFLDAGLKLHSGPNRLDRARKLRQEPVASVLHDAATMSGDCWSNGVHQERRQFGMRTLFVGVHESRVASHIGSQYCR